jgi:hypothetical protein
VPWIFWLNVPIGVVMIPLVRARIPAGAGPRATLDPVGLLLGDRRRAWTRLGTDI